MISMRKCWLFMAMAAVAALCTGYFAWSEFPDGSPIAFAFNALITLLNLRNVVAFWNIRKRFIEVRAMQRKACEAVDAAMVHMVAEFQAWLQAVPESERDKIRVKMDEAVKELRDMRKNVEDA